MTLVLNRHLKNMQNPMFESIGDLDNVYIDVPKKKGKPQLPYEIADLFIPNLDHLNNMTGTLGYYLGDDVNLEQTVHHPQIKAYTKNGKYKGDFRIWPESLGTPYDEDMVKLQVTDVTTDSRYLYSVNAWGFISRWYKGTGEYVNTKTLGALVPPIIGNGKIIERVSYGNNKIAIIGQITTAPSEVYVFEINEDRVNYTYLYTITCPVWSTGANDLCIDKSRNILIVGWGQDFAGGWASLEEYDLNTGAYTDTPELSDQVGVIFGALDFYKDKLYATDVSGRHVIIYSNGNIIRMEDMTTKMFDDPSYPNEPRGIAVNESGIFVSGFYFRTTAPWSAKIDDNLKIYHFNHDLGFVKHIGEVAEYGFDTGGGIGYAIRKGIQYTKPFCLHSHTEEVA